MGEEGWSFAESGGHRLEGLSGETVPVPKHARESPADWGHRMAVGQCAGCELKRCRRIGEAVVYTRCLGEPFV